jgi:hypothetical protein
LGVSYLLMRPLQAKVESTTSLTLWRLRFNHRYHVGARCEVGSVAARRRREQRAAVVSDEVTRRINHFQVSILHLVVNILVLSVAEEQREI